MQLISDKYYQKNSAPADEPSQIQGVRSAGGGADKLEMTDGQKKTALESAAFRILFRRS
jgi:hypothetical protein